MNPLTIAVDVDDVCVDLQKEWLVERLCRRDGFPFSPELLENYWALHNVMSPEWVKRAQVILQEPDLYDNMELNDGVLEAVTFLRKRGHRVVFVTSCVRGASDAKAECLIRHGILPDELLLRDYAPFHDKSLIRADVLVDDGVHNLESFPKWKVLVTRPHNREKGPTKPHWRVEGMLTAAHMIHTYLSPDFGYWDVPASYRGSPEGVTTI